MNKNTPLTPKENDALYEARQATRLLGRFPSVRELMLSMGYKSPRSAAVLLERLEEKGFLERDEFQHLRITPEPEESSFSADTINIPVVGSARCGTPNWAEQNIEDYVKVSTRLAPRDRQHFFLRAKGDSMNEAGIEEGDLVLVRVQNVANNGDRVVALIDDEATIKEFHRRNDIVVLQPRSNNPSHQPIIVSESLQIQGVVVTAIPTL
jgi:repressor LexA